MVNNFLALLFAAISVALAVPHGSYCGGLPSVIGLNITINTLASVTISASIFDAPVAPCTNEPVIYFPANGTVALPNIAKPHDCVGGYLSQYGVDPTSLAVTFDGKHDMLNVAIENGLGTVFSLKQCGKIIRHKQRPVTHH